MKYTAMIMTVFLAAGFTQAQDIKVQADENLAMKADFSKYETFGMMSEAKGNTQPYSHKDKTYGTHPEKEIEKEIKAEMEGLGYEYDNTAPDLLVNFNVFEKPASIPGFKGEGTVVRPGGEPVREVDDTTSYNVEAGTLFVSIMDRENSKVVWQGFASGLNDHDRRFTKNGNKIDEAVERLFDKYDHRANEDGGR